MHIFKSSTLVGRFQQKASVHDCFVIRSSRSADTFDGSAPRGYALTPGLFLVSNDNKRWTKRQIDRRAARAPRGIHKGVAYYYL